MLVRGHAGIAQCTEEDGVKLIAEHFDGARRQGNAFAKILVRTPVECDEFHRPPAGYSHGFQYFDGLRRYLRPDAVAGDYGDAGRGTVISQRNTWQSLASSTTGFAPSDGSRGLQRPGAI